MLIANYKKRKSIVTLSTGTCRKKKGHANICISLDLGGEAYCPCLLGQACVNCWKARQNCSNRTTSSERTSKLSCIFCIEEQSQGWRMNDGPSLLSHYEEHEKQSPMAKGRQGRTHTHTEGTKHTCTLPCFCIYKLNIYWYGFTSVTSLRLHLVLNRVHWIHATEQVSWSHMACVHEVCWLPYHTAVDPPSPFRLRLFRNTAVEAQPEFTHD